jgi:hypothetical protein
MVMLLGCVKGEFDEKSFEESAEATARWFGDAVCFG